MNAHRRLQRYDSITGFVMSQIVLVGSPLKITFLRSTNQLYTFSILVSNSQTPHESFYTVKLKLIFHMRGTLNVSALTDKVTEHIPTHFYYL